MLRLHPPHRSYSKDILKVHSEKSSLKDPEEYPRAKRPREIFLSKGLSQKIPARNLPMESEQIAARNISFNAAPEKSSLNDPEKKSPQRVRGSERVEGRAL